MQGRGAAAAGGRARAGEIVQRPARRERSGHAASAARAQGKGGKSSLRKALAYFPLVAKLTLAVVLGVLLFMGYRAAASASFFQARSVDVSGAQRASADDVRAVVRRGVAHTGVWKADLSGISAELERLPWVRSAVVTRVLPDGLRVRLTERVPRAVVRTSGGKFVWVDEDAVTLAQVQPSDHMPAFFIRGWEEGSTDEARAANRERVQKYLELSQAWETAGLAQRVSELNLGDLHDVRVQLASDDSQIEVRLGEKDFDSRLRRALKVLDEEKSRPNAPNITYLVALDRRIDVGTDRGMQLTGVGAGSNSSPLVNEVNVASRVTNSRRAKETQPKRETEKKRTGDDGKKEQDKAQVKRDANVETRPRRVG
jgi:cell division protein FtsQ